MTERWGLYLSGAGSLDGSDVYSTVIAYEVLQERGFKPVGIGRDVPQGEVLNHRFARPEETSRNALDEAARILRGDVLDMRDVERSELDGAVLVGGGGTLSTWTDYHERGEDCRITERLKFHLQELNRAGKPILCLDNAFLPVVMVLATPDAPLRLNPGSRDRLLDSYRDRVKILGTAPCWDASYRLGTLPDTTRIDHLPELSGQIHELLDAATGNSP